MGMNPFILVFAIAIPSDAGITGEDLIQGFHDAEKAMRTFSVTCDYRIEQWPPPGNISLQSEIQGICTVGTNGRLRYEGFYKKPQGPAPLGQSPRVLAVFDGKRIKSLESSLTGPVAGWVGETGTFPWPVDPRECLHGFYSKPLRQILTEDAGAITGRVTKDGRQLLVVETKPFVYDDGDQTKVRFVVDCERGFAVVRRSVAVFRPALKDWFDYYLFEGHNYSEVMPGIWLPGAVVHEVHYMSSKIAKPAKLSRYEVGFSNWSVNTDIPDKLFTFDFPPAIIIRDEQTGKNYQTVEMSEGKIIRQAVAGMELYVEKRNWAFWRSTFFWALVSLTGVLALGFGIKALRKRRAVSAAGG